jgi:hypothetical protein
MNSILQSNSDQAINLTFEMRPTSKLKIMNALIFLYLSIMIYTIKKKALTQSISS